MWYSTVFFLITVKPSSYLILKNTLITDSFPAPYGVHIIVAGSAVLLYIINIHVWACMHAQ